MGLRFEASKQKPVGIFPPLSSSLF